jgi:hypothetical protein
MVVLLRELVEGVRELTKVTRGVSGLGVQIYQQNAKLIRLGEQQSYLAEKALKGGSGSGSETEAWRSGNKEARKDKGKGKVSEGKEETMKSDGDSDSGEEEDDSGIVTYNFLAILCFGFGFRKEREMGFGDFENYKRIYSAQRPR